LSKSGFVIFIAQELVTVLLAQHFNYLVAVVGAGQVQSSFPTVVRLQIHIDRGVDFAAPVQQFPTCFVVLLFYGEMQRCDAFVVHLIGVRTSFHK